jgi:hypothetical protein
MTLRFCKSSARGVRGDFWYDGAARLMVRGHSFVIKVESYREHAPLSYVIRGEGHG